MINTTASKMMAAISMMKRDKHKTAVKQLLNINEQEYYDFRMMLKRGQVDYTDGRNKISLRVERHDHPLVSDFNIPDLEFHLPAYTVQNFSELTVGNYKERNGV